MDTQGHCSLLSGTNFPVSFWGPWSLGNLNLVHYFPLKSQAFQVTSQTLFHLETVLRFYNLPERWKVLNLHVLVVNRAFTIR